MPKKRQALVEFEDILGACNAVNYAADNQIYIAGHPAFVNYSTSQKISRPGDTDDSRGVNNVLLFTILNPIYSITTVGAALRSPRVLGAQSWARGSLPPLGGSSAGAAAVPQPGPSLLPVSPGPQDVLYTICNPCGPVQRIVIFRKNGVQAMVEYPSVPREPGAASLLVFFFFSAADWFGSASVWLPQPCPGQPRGGS